MRLQVRGPAVAARFPHRSLLADVPELHHRVSSDELQDLPAGAPTADGDRQGVHPPTPARVFSKPGRDPRSGAERPNREAC